MTGRLLVHLLSFLSMDYGAILRPWIWEGENLERMRREDHGRLDWTRRRGSRLAFGRCECCGEILAFHDPDVPPPPPVHRVDFRVNR
jgi:hypothetical protein